MTIEEAIHAIKNEILCVSSQTEQECHRDCEECSLALTDETVLTAYDMAISALRAQQEAEKAKEPIYPCTGCNSGWATYNSSGFTSCHGSCERLKAWWEQAKEDHNV